MNHNNLEMPKLLIIDANDDLFSTLLGQHGIDAISVSNTDEAEFLLSIDHYHAILFDPMIGKTKKDYVSISHGLNFYRYLLGNYKDVPIIIYAAYIDKSHLKEFQQAPAVIYKPVKFEELINTLAKCMGANASGIKLPPENPRKKNSDIYKLCQRRSRKGTCNIQVAES
jgi:CheY-like chemotaxis protein